jgi:hypothetical protein
MVIKKERRVGRFVLGFFIKDGAEEMLGEMTNKTL